MQGKEKENTFNLNRIDFGARSFNPTIARWDGVDPLADARNWVSPYNYVQNNPILRIDPNGAFDTKAEAKQYAKDNDLRTGFFSRNKIQQSDDGSYAINNRKESTSIANDKDFGVMTGALVTGERGGSRSESQIMNDFTSTTTDADIISVGADFTGATGFGFQFQLARINNGPDKGWHLYNTNNANLGASVSAGITYSGLTYNKFNNSGRKELLATDSEGYGNNFSTSYGVMSLGYGYTNTDGEWSQNPKSTNKTLYTTKSIGVGPGFGHIWQGTHSKERLTNKN